MSPYISINALSGIYLILISFVVLRKKGVSPVRIIILCALMGAGYVIGARLLYSIIYFEDTIKQPFKIFELRLINFSMYGGLILAFILWSILSKKWGMDSKKTTDKIIPHVLIALSGSKLACFINGCCYGRPTTLFFGMMFKRADLNPFSRIFVSGDLGKILFKNSLVPRHPTQLYEMFFALIAAAAAFILSRKKTADGLPAVAAVMIYTAGRYVSFLFRAFPGASEISSIMRGPVVYGLVFILCLIYLFRILSNKIHYKDNNGGS